MKVGSTKRCVLIIASLFTGVIFLSGCGKKELAFSKSPNPLPNYIKNYHKARKEVEVKYCRLLNKRTRRAFQGIGANEAEAKKSATNMCILHSHVKADCTVRPTFKCGKRKQLELIDGED